LSPATLGKECVKSTQGEIRIAPAGRGMPWSRITTSILSFVSYIEGFLGF
jgi:hypothetical protein